MVIYKESVFMICLIFPDRNFYFSERIIIKKLLKLFINSHKISNSQLERNIHYDEIIWCFKIYFNISTNFRIKRR